MRYLPPQWRRAAAAGGERLTIHDRTGPVSLAGRKAASDRRSTLAVMHGVPNRETLTFIEGREFEQVRFARYFMLLEFDGDVSITAEGSFSLTVPGAKEVVADDVSYIAGALVRQIGESVVGVEVSGTRALLLTFSGGHVLRLIDDSRQFESFQVRQGNQLIVV